MSDEARASGPVAISWHPEEIAGRYRVRRRLGEGGMGVVYECEHARSKQRVAVKVLFPHLCHGAQAIERFRREVRASDEIDHPGVVRVLDAGVDGDGSFYIAMELLVGETLADRLRARWPGTYEAVEILRQLLAPLGRAHERGFVHRDLKPENIFLVCDETTGRSVLKILDFGLAREVQRKGPTLTGVTFGTPEYMSPEQALSAKKAELPADVWSVGVLGYELLSGFLPFDGETPNAVMVAAITNPFVPLRERAPHVPPALALVIEACLDKDPKKRPADARAVAILLDRALSDVTLADTRPERTHLDVARERREREGAEEDVGARAPPVAARVGAEGRERDVATQPFAVERAEAPRRLAITRGLMLAPILAALVLGAGIVLSVRHAVAPAPSPPAAAAPPSAEPPAPPLAPALGTAPLEPSLGLGTSGPVADHALSPTELAEAEACLSRGEPDCAIEILRRGSSAVDLARLVEVYASLGRTLESRAAMERFVRRHPRAPEAVGYRARLAGE